MTIPNNITEAIQSIVHPETEEVEPRVKRQKPEESPLEVVAAYVATNSDKLTQINRDALTIITGKIREIRPRERSDIMKKAHNEIEIHLSLLQFPEFSNETLELLKEILKIMSYKDKKDYILLLLKNNRDQAEKAIANAAKKIKEDEITIDYHVCLTLHSEFCDLIKIAWDLDNKGFGFPLKDPKVLEQTLQIVDRVQSYNSTDVLNYYDIILGLNGDKVGEDHIKSLELTEKFLKPFTLSQLKTIATLRLTNATPRMLQYLNKEELVTLIGLGTENLQLIIDEENESLLPHILSIFQGITNIESIDVFFHNVLLSGLPLIQLGFLLSHTDPDDKPDLINSLLLASDPTETLSEAYRKAQSASPGYERSLILYFEMFPNENSSQLISLALEIKELLGKGFLLSKEFIKNLEKFQLWKPLLKKIPSVKERHDFYWLIFPLNDPETFIPHLLNFFPDEISDMDYLKEGFSLIYQMYGQKKPRFDPNPILEYPRAINRLTGEDLLKLFQVKNPSGKTHLQCGDNFKLAVEKGILQRLSKEELDALIRGPYSYGLTLLHDPKILEASKPLGLDPNAFLCSCGLPPTSKIFTYLEAIPPYLREPRTRLIQLLENNKVPLVSREKFLEQLHTLLNAFDEVTKSLVLKIILNEPDALQESVSTALDLLKNRKGTYRKALLIFSALNPFEGSKACIDMAIELPWNFANFTRPEVDAPVMKRALQLLPHYEKLPEDDRGDLYYEVLIHTTPTSEFSTYLRDHFFEALPLLKELQPEEVTTILTKTDQDGLTLLHNPQIYKAAENLIQEKGINVSEIPKTSLGLSLRDYHSVLNDEWVSEKKLGEKFLEEISDENYNMLSAEVSSYLLQLWDNIPFASMPDSQKNILLEVNKVVQTQEYVRECLNLMLDKLQNRTAWLGTPKEPEQEALNSFYREQLFCFENIAKVLIKANDPVYTAGLLVSVASPQIEGRCATAYVDELNQKVELIDSEQTPKDLEDRFEHRANKALYKYIQDLGSKLHFSEAHSMRQLKYVCGFALTPDDDPFTALPVEEAKYEVQSEFDLVTFLNDLNFPDDLCDLYLEEYLIPDRFGADRIALQKAYELKESEIKKSLHVPENVLDKISSMKSSLGLLYKESLREASKEHLINRSLDLSEKALKLSIRDLIQKPLESLTYEDIDQLEKELTGRLESRGRSYFREDPSTAMKKIGIEKGMLANFINALYGIAAFDIEMRPLNLMKKDLLSAFKARLTLEQEYLQLGKELEDHDILFRLQAHTVPSKAIRKARIFQYIKEEIDPECTYTKKLLYIAQETGILS